MRGLPKGTVHRAGSWREKMQPLALALATDVGTRKPLLLRCTSAARVFSSVPNPNRCGVGRGAPESGLFFFGVGGLQRHF